MNTNRTTIVSQPGEWPEEWPEEWSEDCGYTDCLVLCIEQKRYGTDMFVEDNYPVNTMYVYYDTYLKEYVVRGKTPRDTYSFYCRSKRDLNNFIGITFDDKNTLTIYLYNYKSMPIDSNDIDVDYLEDNIGSCLMTKTQNYTYELFSNLLGMVYSLYNPY